MDVRELIATCPLGRAFLREEAAARAEGRGLDMTALWKEAGRPRCRSPRHWLARRHDKFQDEGGGPDGRVLAEAGAVLFYATVWLDRTRFLAKNWSGITSWTAQFDPAPRLAQPGAGHSALLAKLDLMAGGITDEEAGRHLIGQVAQHVAARGPDVYAAETEVMHAQRAIADFDATGLLFDRDGNPIS